MTRTISFDNEDLQVRVSFSCQESNFNMCDSDSRLCDGFSEDYRKFTKEFDHLCQDGYAGEKLNQICQDFLAKCDQHKCFHKIPYSIVGTKFPHCNNNEALSEDLKLVSGELTKVDASECSRTLSNLYRRVCQGHYLLITLKKYRQNADRWRAVEYARHAIRYDPINFEACWWYMIALGWRLDVTTSPRERTLVARTFYQTIQYNIELDPSDPLAYHLLGRYYYNVARLSWIERTVAEKLLGAPMVGTYEDAERELRRAYQLKNDWMPQGLWMARVLMAQKRPVEEIKQWIDFGLALDCTEPSSEIELEELLELKSKLKIK